MDFLTAEEKFQELQARIRRGEAMSEDQYQEELAKLMVQDESGVFWSLEPGTGRWLYFNGTEWVLGNPPRQAAPPPVAPVYTPPPAETYEPIEPTPYAPAPQEPTYEPSAEAPSYYAPSDAARPYDYSGTYTGTPSYGADSGMPSAYNPGSGAPGAFEPEGMSAYVRMPEPETTMPGGGIPPRPVREASPLAVPGGERAWLPFAFGALVLLLCAVVLFFGVRGFPQFSGGAAGTDPTEEATEIAQDDVLPTETVDFEPTDEPAPTEEPTEEPQPTAEPQPVRAVTTDVLNVREGPARTTTAVDKLALGTEVEVIGRNADNTWLQIERPNDAGPGWVSAEFVTISGDLNSLPIVEGDSGAQPAATETPTG